MTKAFDAKLVDVQIALADMVDDLSNTAPAGSETAVKAFRNAVGTSQNVIASARSSAKRAMELAEASCVSMAKRTVNATTIVARMR